MSQHESSEISLSKFCPEQNALEKKRRKDEREQRMEWFYPKFYRKAAGMAWIDLFFDTAAALSTSKLESPSLIIL